MPITDPHQKLDVSITRFNDQDQIALITLNGALTVPIGTRIEVWEDGNPVDYIVNNCRLRHEETTAGLYYECHRAEKTGTSAADDLLPPV